MSPTLVTLEVVGTLCVLALCVFDGAWYWWAMLGASVILDLVNILVQRKARQVQQQADRARLLSEFRRPPEPLPIYQDTPAPAPAARAAAARALDALPERVGKAFQYATATDVVYRAAPGGFHGVPLTEAELRLDGERVAVVQKGQVIGYVDDAEDVKTFSGWLAAGDPVRAALETVPFRASTGRLVAALYRDELARLSQRKDAFTARIGAPEHLEESDIGRRLAVILSEETGRYTLYKHTLPVGVLPDSAVAKLRATDREPEDAVYYLSGVADDPDLGKRIWSVLIA